MKKILLSVVAMGLMSVSAFALDGKIGAVNFMATGKIWVTIVKADGTIVNKKLVGSGDIRKSLIAALLTAKSTNADVTVWSGTVDGISGWKDIVLK